MNSKIVYATYYIFEVEVKKIVLIRETEDNLLVDLKF